MKYKNCNQSNCIKKEKSYYFKLQSKAFSLELIEIGSIEAEKIIEIWNKKISNFDVCSAENSKGLYCLKNEYPAAFQFRKASKWGKPSA